MEFVLVGLVLLGGCRGFGQRDEVAPLPAMLTSGASLNDVMGAVNSNSYQIQSFTTRRAQISGPGFPTLRDTSIAFQRPNRLRLQAGTTVMGPELDLGSNDELFWIWVGRNDPPDLFYCRHEERATCAATRRIPIEPQWLIEALGIVEFHPADRHEGPRPLPGGNLEVTTIRNSAAGPTKRVAVIDGVSAAVLSQRIYDAREQLLVTITTSRHRRDPWTGLVTPQVVQIESPANGISMQIDLGVVEINRPVGNAGELFTLPTYLSDRTVNVCDPAFQAGPGAPTVPPPTARPSQTPSYPRMTQRLYNRLPH